ncbi:hypothetical protein LGH82_12995 [Mesorhizobium sp. PAMC28654]|jgi:hypothetical protein|uniref:hypothetical protein n=1 Tax=Mesorhizobium sp. PAMC28654 TaxID=2880934 RepID=UPI001D0B1C38|nr:hypothetical protein [Mesorhizobium sp. PAMC28654]UDL92064.1 hypothetical protein LGH82_12995 [Mesorhizobium sp. PAMC28654]
MTDEHPNTQGDEHRLFERISRERFDALVLWGMPQPMREDTLSASHWSADNERVIAGVFHVIDTKEFMCVAFARDTAGRYRPFQRSHFLPSARAGELALKRDFGRGLLTAQPELSAADARPEGVDLFATLGNIGRHHDAYVMLRDGFNQGAARALLEEVSSWVPDLDGNLVRDFQTSGYSARAWELYLRAALRALNFDMDHTHAAPDFCVRKGGKTVFVEATTVNSQDNFQLGDRRGPAAGRARTASAVPRKPDATEVRVATLFENEEALLGEGPCGGPSAPAGNRRLSCTGVNALVARRPAVLSLWAADGDDRRHRQPAH